MSGHRQRVIPKRMFAIGYSDSYMEQKDREQEDRRNTPSQRYCSLCHGSGFNCPECSGWDDEEYIEEEEDQ